MKKILVPTDFSDAANNALEYALKLASVTNASVTILNVYHVPLPAGEVPLMLISPHEILEKSHEKLRDLAAAARVAYENKFPVKTVVRQGFAAEEIVNVADELKVDLVITGTTGTGSALAAVLGSVTVEVMKKSSVPVLVIPADARFVPVRQMALAFDYTEPRERTITLLKKYAQWLGAEINVVNVVTPEAKADVKASAAGVALDDSLTGIPHHLYFPEGTGVVAGLSQFIKDHKSDWLVVVPHAYGFFQTLFHRSVSNQAAMRIEIPVLSIHE